jgi:hypothetical protein
VRLQHREHAELRRRQFQIAAGVLEHGRRDLVGAPEQETWPGIQPGQLDGIAVRSGHC